MVDEWLEKQQMAEQVGVLWAVLVDLLAVLFRT